MNNTINLVGNVGNDPVVTTFASGTKLAKFSLAVKEFAGDNQVKTMWIDIEAWGQTADRILDVIKKGREVAVMGRLSINTYDKEVAGQTVKMTKPVVKLLGFHACGRKHQAETEILGEDTANDDNAPSKGRKRTAA